MRFRERLGIPVWWWLAAPALTALLAAEIYLGRPGWATAVPYLILLPAVVGGLWWLGRITITVTATELVVDDARLPLHLVGPVTVLDEQARQELLGPSAEPLAFVIQRPWVPRAVRVDLLDPADPTPYWLISTRHPKRLADLLSGARV